MSMNPLPRLCPAALAAARGGREDFAPLDPKAGKHCGMRLGEGGVPIDFPAAAVAALAAVR